jgi:transcriptional regulator with XRE-family HTH domain
MTGLTPWPRCSRSTLARSSNAIRGYRYRENLTQRQLAELTGIPQRHISEMENGKRTIGKEMAKRLAKALHTDYKMFLGTASLMRLHPPDVKPSRNIRKRNFKRSACGRPEGINILVNDFGRRQWRTWPAVEQGNPVEIKGIFFSRINFFADKKV